MKKFVFNSQSEAETVNQEILKLIVESNPNLNPNCDRWSDIDEQNGQFFISIPDPTEYGVNFNYPIGEFSTSTDS